jgi:hypothetical protein
MPADHADIHQEPQTAQPSIQERERVSLNEVGPLNTTASGRTYSPIACEKGRLATATAGRSFQAINS